MGSSSLKAKAVFLNVRVPITREIMRSRDARWDQFRFLGNCPPTPPLSHH